MTESAGRRFADAVEALQHGQRADGREYSFVLLDGAPLSGVTRSMYEAVRSCLPSSTMLYDWNALTLATTVADPDALKVFDDQLASAEHNVIWLDDLSPADLLLLTPAVLDAMSRRALILASINTSWADRILADRSPVTTSGRAALLEYAARVNVPFALTPHEQARLNAQYPHLDFSTSIGEALVGGNVLVRRYRTADAAPAGGRALVEAAIDARRTGLHRGVHENELKDLLPRGGVAPQGQRQFEQALQWATSKPADAGTGILLPGKEMGTWKVMSYVAAADDGEHGNPSRPIADRTWDAVTATVPAEDAFQVGVAAHLRGLASVADKAFRRAASADHPVVAARAAAILN